MGRLYAVACVLGAAGPLAFLGAFVVEEGVDPHTFAEEVTASRLSLMAWSDVVVAGIVVIGLAFVEGARGRVRRWWLPAAATALVGPSLGLPLLLLLKERARRAAGDRTAGV